MIVDSVFTNAKVYLNNQIVDCCIAIEEGKIHKIGKEPQMPNADQKTDLHNLLVLPGLIDEHVHLRDQGQAYKEDFFSGTSAAAAGGFCTVLDMPNNDPVTMNVETLRTRTGIAQRRILVNVGFYSAFPKNLIEIEDIASEGIVGFKLFMGGQIGALNVDDDTALKEALKTVAKSKVIVAVHAEDKQLLENNEVILRQAKKNAPIDYLKAHTEIVELKSVQRILKISEKTGVRLHFCHISTKDGLKSIAEVKKIGRTVTCEVTLNHLLLSINDLPRYGSLALTAPPIRDRSHVDALWRGLDDGSIDALGSDHAPHALNEKLVSNVWDVKVGIPGLETTLPLLLTLVHKNRLSLSQVIHLLAERPAEIYSLFDRGRLDNGKPADLTIIDYNRKFKIDSSKFKSKAKFSPYDGWEVWGKPIKTIVNGQLVFDEGEIVAKGGNGSIIRGGVS